MSDTIDPDLRLVLLAAGAFLFWRDMDVYPTLMGDEIDPVRLSEAIDRLGVKESDKQERSAVWLAECVRCGDPGCVVHGAELRVTQ